MVAVDDDSLLSIRFQFAQALRQFAHRNQLRAVNSRDLIFVGLTAIEQQEGGLGGEQRIDGLDVDAQRQILRHGVGSSNKGAA